MFKVLAFVLLLVALGVAEPSIGYPELSLSCGKFPFHLDSPWAFQVTNSYAMICRI